MFLFQQLLPYNVEKAQILLEDIKLVLTMQSMS